ncbi:MAG: hypothetical protein N3B18_07775 [Desulfobacterota bacterium]|nr:hypothetical protein [Thermodesulfobacteriota bacterium]
MFFIPVIPYDTTYYLSCEICGCGIEFEGEEVEKLKQVNAITMKFLEQHISQEHYIAELNRYGAEMLRGRTD